MKKIKFRGQRVDSHEWVYGYLSCLRSGDKAYIAASYHDIHYEVIPESVGQFIGLNDKNGTEIYGGDRVRRRLVDFNKEGGFMDIICDIKWSKWCYALFIADKQMWGLDPITARTLEVIGNIYENPELLNP